jgi:hypothetical protein
MPAHAQHECDLFLLSSHRAHAADRLLPEFARRGNRNIHGWERRLIEVDLPIARIAGPPR